jgi:hypothetical protein
MLFSVENKNNLAASQLKTNTVLNAYFIIKNYPLNTSEKILNNYIQDHYNISLKNLCIKLLLDLTYYCNDEGNLILFFKNPASDRLAQLITYGNGRTPGSRILQIALKTK